MYLSKIRIKNYKSFRDSGDIEFQSGINIIVGQNNSGKTTLLEALEIRIGDIPHINFKNPKEKPLLNENEYKSIVNVSVRLLKNELPILSELKDDFKFFIPFPERILNSLNPKTPIGMMSISKEEQVELNATITKQKREIIDKFVKKFILSLNEGITAEFKYQDLNPLNYTFNLGIEDKTSDEVMKALEIRWYKAESKFYSGYGLMSLRGLEGDFFLWKEVISFREKVYRFSAERPNLGGCFVGFDKNLKPDGSNLAEVLQNIQNDNHDVYEEFNSCVSEVIPSVKWVSSVKIKHEQTGAGNWNEVRVWSVDKKSRRTDLAFPLNVCGTGIGQVLAILFVVVASEDPRTIIIDEPNSFLHPSASKKLIQILNKFPQHQYFISTHSPEILATANPSTVTMLKYEDGETKVEQLDLSQGNDKLKLVSELGMEISDFFFAENILWVEGPTEAKAFPMILAKSKSLFSFVAVPLVHTDDLKDRKRGRKHARTNIENIRRLSGEYALTPPKIFTILDREDTSDQEIQDLEKLGINFIPRRLFENYLLDAEAITEILNSEIIELSEKVTVKQIEDILTTSQNEFSDETEWLQKVHGAKLLENIFSDLSNKTVEYRKTTHSVELTKWLLENKPEQLEELQNFLLETLENSEQN